MNKDSPLPLLVILVVLVVITILCIKCMHAHWDGQNVRISGCNITGVVVGIRLTRGPTILTVRLKDGSEISVDSSTCTVIHGAEVQ